MMTQSKKKRMESIIARWQRGEKLLTGWLSMPGSFSAELVSSHDWDCMTIDAQHGMLDFSDVVPMMQAIRANHKQVIVRIPWLREESVMKYLDAGASGIICPMVNSVEQAQSFVRFSTYAPWGERSYGPTRALIVNGGDYFHEANESMIRLAMIETKEGVTHADAILQVDGISGLFIGPSDLAVSYGYPPGFDRTESELVGTIENLLILCHKYEKKIGIFAGSVEYGKRAVALGFDLINVQNDARLLSSAVASTLQQLRGV